MMRALFHTSGLFIAILSVVLQPLHASGFAKSISSGVSQDDPIFIRYMAEETVSGYIHPSLSRVNGFLVNESFENTWPSGDWTLVDLSTQDGGEYVWGKRDCHPHQGTYAGWSVGGGTGGSLLECTAGYPDYVSTWAIYGPFDLSNATDARITFYLWGGSEAEASCAYDYLYVGSSTDGTTFTDGGRYCGNWTDGDEINGYFKQMISLNSKLGQDQVWLGLKFASDDSYSDQGFNIDDLSIDVVARPSEPTGSVTIQVDTTTDAYEVAYQVCSDNIADDCSLRGAISKANADPDHAYEIVLQGGVVYPLSLTETGENLNQSGDLDIASYITVTSTGDKRAVINGNEIDRIFHIHEGAYVSLNDVTLTGGQASPTDDGGSIYNAGTLRIDHVYIYGNQAGDGPTGFPGLDGANGAPGSSHHGEDGDPGGPGGPGGLGGDGFDGGDGGGIYNRGILTVTHSTISDNNAGDGGRGGEGGWGGRGGEGGASYWCDSCYGGVGGKGGSGGRGGTGGMGVDGGGIFNAGQLGLENSTVTSNYAGSGGKGGNGGKGGRGGNGGMSLLYGAPGGDGGNGGSGGSGGDGGYGAGLAGGGVITIRHSTISHNSAGAAGSAGYGGAGGSGGLGYIMSAGDDGSAGAGGTLGASGDAGGVDGRTSTITLFNTILADNQAPSAPDCHGTLHSKDFNLIETTSNCNLEGIVAHLITGTTPDLKDLSATNEAPPTRALSLESPALDAGSCDGVSQDQRGASRPVDIPDVPNIDSACDIGAFELQIDEMYGEIYLPIVIK